VRADDSNGDQAGARRCAAARVLGKRIRSRRLGPAKRAPGVWPYACSQEPHGRRANLIESSEIEAGAKSVSDACTALAPRPLAALVAMSRRREGPPEVVAEERVGDAPVPTAGPAGDDADAGERVERASG
jgi:hypothetical protein